MFLRTVLEKVSCFDAPTRLVTKGADLREISNTNLSFLVNVSFLVQKQNYKLAFRKLTKGKLKQYNLSSLLAIDTPIRLLPSYVTVPYVTEEYCMFVKRTTYLGVSIIWGGKNGIGAVGEVEEGTGGRVR